MGGNGLFQWIHASHDAWRWLPGAPVHHRLLAVADDAALVLDVVLGGGQHRVASALHLHPDGSEALRAWPLRGDVASESAPLHERFGQTRPMTRLRIEERDAALPWLGGWWLAPRGEGSRPRASLFLDGLVARAEVEHAGAQIAVRWDVGAPALPSSVAIDVLASRA